MSKTKSSRELSIQHSSLQDFQHRNLISVSSRCSSIARSACQRQLQKTIRCLLCLQSKFPTLIAVAFVCKECGLHRLIASHRTKQSQKRLDCFHELSEAVEPMRSPVPGLMNNTEPIDLQYKDVHIKLSCRPKK